MTTPSELPDRLVEQLQNGRCVLVVGTGVARAVGAPTWREVIADLAPTLDGPGLQSDQVLAMSDDDVEVLGELLAAELGPKRISLAIRDRLKQQPRLPVPPWVQILARLPFAAVISLNWDDSFERLVRSRGPEILLPGRPPPDRLDADRARLRILKPLGHTGNAGSLLLSLADFNRRYGASSDFGRLLGATLAANTVLFVGTHARTINELLSSAGVAGTQGEHPDFAVLDDDSALDARLVRARHNVHRLPIPVPEQFVPALALSVAAQPRRRTPQWIDHPVHELRLENIGPFRHLHVRFADEWTVLLGDNGAGKSTVLRALAFALCGGSVLPGEADHLLMAGRKGGVIDVTVGETRYVTSLLRERTGVRVKTAAPTPVETGEMLALGFPAFRGVSRKAPTGPREERVLGVGHPSDLEALRTGAVDTRLDELQQWLINLAVVHRADDLFGDADRAGERIDSVFALWERLMPGMQMRYAGLNTDRWEVLVSLNGSTVPLRTFSQGALSTVSWVGTLVRRLVDRYRGGADELAAMPALVIVDELDAHLHPEWQRLIVPRLREALPNVQVIATTHSPLIVGALEPGEVLTLHRDHAGHGSVEQAEEFRGWRADQILTSPAFGLDTSRDAKTERDLEEYQTALGERPVNPELFERVANLPRSGETAIEREAAELVDAGLRERLAELPDERRAALVRQAAKYLRRVRGGEG
ncbi:AAA family ATPase [Dactylosporangium sp. NPDC051484]|uniref:AAA family ATPase n=1 Tax=Dactylosporangium sp. NPDC051484 TaxID=3154942 RepID=UPI0034510037